MCGGTEEATGKPDSAFFINYYYPARLCQVVSHADTCNFTLSVCLLLDPQALLGLHGHPWLPEETLLLGLGFYHPELVVRWQWGHSCIYDDGLSPIAHLLLEG